MTRLSIEPLAKLVSGDWLPHFGPFPSWNFAPWNNHAAHSSPKMDSKRDCHSSTQSFARGSLALFGLFCMVSALCPLPAHAASWDVVQGDLLRLDIALPRGNVRLTALGKTWPWKRLDNGRIRAWIGVDMAVKPGRYDINIRDQGGRIHHVLHVIKANFRISRIHVERRMAEFDARALAHIHSDHVALKKAYGIHVDAAPDIAIARAPVDGIVSTPFGARRYVNGEARSPHSGLDIAAAEGAPIMNPLPGRVLLAESMFLNGNTVVIGHGSGLVMIYSHLKALHVRKGEWIRAGGLIGKVGKTGRATGPHLHWGVRFQGARINPASLLTREQGKPSHAGRRVL